MAAWPTGSGLGHLLSQLPTVNFLPQALESPSDAGDYCTRGDPRDSLGLAIGQFRGSKPSSK